MELPVIVGIAGGTGSGKTTISQRVQEGLGARSCIIQHDWYYHDRSGLAADELAQVNFDHPHSLDNELLVAHLLELKAGRAIEAPQYDFSRHARQQKTVTIEPLPVLIVEGILLFALPELRKVFDIKLFVDTDADIRVFRRIRRDIRERGRDFESIRQQYYDTVRPMHIEFVEPSKRWADLIIPEGGDNQIALDVIVERLRRFIDA
ncbi:MAG: uridine kinase [Bradymonadaceae bacterium]|nr:uridine kinase [Lujinxingiaceae bacterium]